MASEAYQQLLAAQKVTTRTIDAKGQVLKAWGPEYGRDEVVYVFANGKRKFLSTDRRTSGIYQPPD